MPKVTCVSIHFGQQGWVITGTTIDYQIFFPMIFGVNLRHEMARLLGYHTYADYVLVRRMAKWKYKLLVVNIITLFG
ncbi:MAG: hypothetical protein ACFCUM_09780 [Bacteroidales bacterium]